MFHWPHQYINTTDKYICFVVSRIAFEFITCYLLQQSILDWLNTSMWKETEFQYVIQKKMKLAVWYMNLLCKKATNIHQHILTNWHFTRSWGKNLYNPTSKHKGMYNLYIDYWIHITYLIWLWNYHASVPTAGLACSKS